MTTDPFAEAARAEAEAVMRAARERVGITVQEQTRYVEGYVAGAEWARTHLAAQEATDEEVLAAAWAVCRLQDEGYEPTEDHPCKACTESARAALTAAREVGAQ